jgi:hypothetical protein
MQKFYDIFLNLNLHRDIIMLNLTKEGRPFAKIIGGKYNNQVISVSEKSDEGFKYLGISNDANFQLIPNPKTEREILYVTGPSWFR